MRITPKWWKRNAKNAIDRISELKGITNEKRGECERALNELKKMAEDLGTSDSEILNTKQQNTLAELALVRGEFIHSQFELNE